MAGAGPGRLRRWGGWALAALAAAALALAWTDRCGAWDAQAPQVLSVGRGKGVLKVGAAVAPLELPAEVTVAGYPPPRPTARGTAAPLAARATALDVGGQLVTLVTLDVLLVPARLQLAVQAGLPGRVWLLATHTHSGPGGQDARPAAEVAALGQYRPAVEAALVAAARAAAGQAQARLAPARLELAEGALEGLTVARSGASVDRRLTVLRFLAGRPVAQWLVVSAHPTLVPAAQDLLDPDWPGRLSRRAEAGDGPVTLVLQGAGGNATVDRTRATDPEAFAALVLEAAAALPGGAVAAPDLGWAEVGFGLPHPDGSRLLAGWLRTPLENLLCAGAEHDALVAVLRLGPASLVLTTVEPSEEAGRLLLERARATRVLGLANGYHGYLEPEAVARAGQGEARRQYFGPEFMRLLGDAAQAAGTLAGP